MCQLSCTSLTPFGVGHVCHWHSKIFYQGCPVPVINKEEWKISLIYF